MEHQELQWQVCHLSSILGRYVMIHVVKVTMQDWKCHFWGNSWRERFLFSFVPAIF
jgi:hypothetical protein